VDQYLPLVVMLVLAVGFVVLSLVTTQLLARSRPNAAKAAPYESGIVPSREPPERFPVRFYLVAMIFIIFDIEIIFLYPYAVLHRELGGYGFLEILAFSAAVFAAFVYLLSRGALDWGPVQRDERRAAAAVGPERTVDSTVRRVGLEGREPAPVATAPIPDKTPEVHV
jgi:NADH-quinone oxidoreductase subunit A